MVGEVDTPGQALDGMNCLLAQRGAGVGSLIRPHDERNDELQVFLDVRAKGQECVEYLHLSVGCLLVEFTLKDLEDRGENHGNEWLELSIESLAKGLDKRHQR